MSTAQISELFLCEDNNYNNNNNNNVPTLTRSEGIAPIAPKTVIQMRSSLQRLLCSSLPFIVRSIVTDLLRFLLSRARRASNKADHIICPTNMLDHSVFLSGWADRFPRARFWGLQGVDLPGAHFTAILSMETFPDEWREELDLSIMEASPFLRECFLYHRSTKTVFSMDSLVLLTPEEVPNPMAQKAFAIMQGFNTPTCFVKPLMLDRRSCQAAVSKVLDWDFSTVYPTHGACPIYDGKNAIASAFDFLWD